MFKWLSEKAEQQILYDIARYVYDVVMVDPMFIRSPHITLYVSAPADDRERMKTHAFWILEKVRNALLKEYHAEEDETHA